MRRILIIGAGQSGLQLALTLLRHGGYDVTVMTALPAAEILGGRITSTQCMFYPALDIEREAGLNFWEDAAPAIQGLRVVLAGPEGKMLEFHGLGGGRPSSSVDQRIKMAGWLEWVETLGGRVQVHPVTTGELEALASLYDLTIVAAGKGELVELFDRNPAHSPFTRPQRRLAAIYLHGVKPWPTHPVPQLRLNLIPGAGEIFFMPALTKTGHCEAILVEAIPGGPFDRWTDRGISPTEHLKRFQELTAEWAPWEYELITAAEPTDSRCTLYGGYTPIVRHPVATVGRQYVLGMGDVVVLNDPIAGQGANNACHCAAIYYQAIIEHGDKPFTPEWMHATFARYWNYAQWSTKLTNMLLQPSPPHLLQILKAAAMDQVVADRFVYGGQVPPSLADWFFDADRAAAYLKQRRIMV